jgi:peptidoglycan/xylan/chitin deacetylase (PgdA/CDA1 family)
MGDGGRHKPLLSLTSSGAPQNCLATKPHLKSTCLAPLQGFACINYHVIGHGAGQYVLSEEQFKIQIDYLRSTDYLVDGFDELEAKIHSGCELPPRYVVLTIDDGDESSIRAAELLRMRGFKATFFLTRDRCKNKIGYIREHQIRELHAEGFSLGTHGTTHRKLTFVGQQECVEELEASKRWLEDVVGDEVRFMAVPGGYINSRVLRQAKGCGYSLVGTCNEWINSPRRMTLSREVNRVNIRQQFSFAAFRQVLEGSPAFYLWRQLRSGVLALPKHLLRD